MTNPAISFSDVYLMRPLRENNAEGSFWTAARTVGDSNPNGFSTNATALSVDSLLGREGSVSVMVRSMAGMPSLKVNALDLSALAYICMSFC